MPLSMHAHKLTHPHTHSHAPQYAADVGSSSVGRNAHGVATKAPSSDTTGLEDGLDDLELKEEQGLTARCARLW